MVQSKSPLPPTPPCGRILAEKGGHILLTSIIYSELVQFREQPVRRPDGPTEMIRYLTNQGYIHVLENTVSPGMIIFPTAWEITVKGISALSEFEEVRRKESEDKRQQHLQNQIAIAQVLVPLITFILGLVVEHFSGIVGIIAQILR